MNDTEQRVRLKARVFLFVRKLFRIQPMVHFSDVQLLAADVKPPPFGTQEGEYERAGVVILGNGSIASGSIPDTLECPSEFVIYASNAAWLLICRGFGPDHAVVRTARQNADAAAAGITCADGCEKVVSEIWRGWHCAWQWGDGAFLGTGAVELKVSCRITA